MFLWLGLCLIDFICFVGLRFWVFVVWVTYCLLLVSVGFLVNWLCFVGCLFIVLLLCCFLVNLLLLVRVVCFLFYDYFGCFRF